MIKNIVIVFIAFLAIKGSAQESTTSPYSFYGIGSLKFKGTVENRSMGGLSIYSDSIHMNLRNPASYTGNNLEIFGKESRPVKFTVGGTYSNVNLKTESSKDNASTTSFDYLAISVPMGKFGLGFGIRPHTSVGYKLESLNDNNQLSNRFRGEGGLNKAFLGLGYQITEKLSVGFDVHYNFGSIQNNVYEFQYDEEGDAIQFQSREDNRSDLSGASVNLGMHYKTMLNNKLEFVSGITYAHQSFITSKNERSFSAIVITTDDEELVSNTIDIDLEALGLLETELVLPSTFSFGAGIGKPRKWFVGTETNFVNTSSFSNQLYSSGSTTYKNAYSLSLGGFFIPRYNSFSKYWERVVYRGGIRAEETGLVIENEPINEFGISFGLGLPLLNGLSNANLGFEIGKRGTTKSNLIQENFVNLQISLSLNDRWFQKRKFD